MIDKDQLKQKESLDNSLSKNKYCFCKNYGEVDKCLICKSLKEGKDYQKINSDGANKYTVAITGTNGKTTLTNIIGLVLNNVYKKVGYTSTTGVFKERTKISDLEHRASEHYVYLLNQSDLDIVISEQPEAGIYKYGLPRDHNFGIVINMSEDHLERYWINSGMDDLYAIKSLVAKMSIEGCVTSVDYYWTRKLIDDFDRGHFFLFGRNKIEVEKYLKKGYQIITEQNGEIVILKNKEKIVVGKTNDFLLTLNGILEYNIENLVKEGKIISPVRGAVLTGNGPESLLSIEAVGSDLHFLPGMCGKGGQNVPVTDGQPSLLLKNIVVGGSGA